MFTYFHIIIPIFIYFGISFWISFIPFKKAEESQIPFGIRVLLSVVLVQITFFLFSIILKIPLRFINYSLITAGSIGIIGYVIKFFKTKDALLNKIKFIFHPTILFPAIFIFLNGSIIPAFVKRRWDAFTHWSVPNYIVLFYDRIWDSSDILTKLVNPAYFFYPPGSAFQTYFFHMFSTEYIEGLALWGIAFYYFVFFGVVYDIIKEQTFKVSTRFSESYFSIILALGFCLFFSLNLPILKFLELYMGKHFSITLGCYFLVYFYLIQKRNISLSSATVLGSILSWVGIQRPYALEEIFAMFAFTIFFIIVYNIIFKKKIISKYLIWHFMILIMPLIVYCIWKTYVSSSGGFYQTSHDGGLQIGFFKSVSSKSKADLLSVAKRIQHTFSNSYHSYRFPHKGTSILLFGISTFILFLWTIIIKLKNKYFLKKYSPSIAHFRVNYNNSLKQFLPVFLFFIIHSCMIFYVVLVAPQYPEEARWIYPGAVVLLIFSFYFFLDLFFSFFKIINLFSRKHKVADWSIKLIIFIFFIWGIRENIAYNIKFPDLYVKDLNHCWYSIYKHTEMDFVRLVKNRDIIENTLKVTKRNYLGETKVIGIIITKGTRKRLLLYTLNLLFGKHSIIYLTDTNFPIEEETIKKLDILYVFDKGPNEINILGHNSLNRDAILIKKENGYWQYIQGYTKRSKNYSKKTLEDLKDIYLNKTISNKSK